MVVSPREPGDGRVRPSVRASAEAFLTKRTNQESEKKRHNHTGMSYSAIAKRMRLSRAVVWRRINLHTFTRHSRHSVHQEHRVAGKNRLPNRDTCFCLASIAKEKWRPFPFWHEYFKYLHIYQAAIIVAGMEIAK
jgi:hypothetical protein